MSEHDAAGSRSDLPPRTSSVWLPAGTQRTVLIDAAGAHIDDAGLARPSATWTYMVSDNPLAGKGNSVLSGIGNIFR